ncbi:hydroxymethylbilane synthase [Acidaminococcus sp. LBK-2]|uniref:hydroxymethylbilane synthase n=1 Tax=Acidaminococcus sp. LBK-2 TaxID=3456956 RepID=UPI003FA448C0
MKKLIAATRGSRLALAQTYIVCRLLEEAGVETEIRTITTAGDRDRIHALVKIGGRGIFVREIERELLCGEADIAVHSAKDLPYQLADGLLIAGTPKAADPRDALILPAGKSLEPGMAVGTGSPRRIQEIGQLYPDLVFRDIRGNVTTRLHKLERGEYDAIVLAMAGIQRMDLDLSRYQVLPLPVEQVMPAGCQGIIGIECRRGDRDLVRLLQRISDPETWRRFQWERELFCSMKVDCSCPVGIHCRLLDQGRMELLAMVDGKRARRLGLEKEGKALCASLKEELYDWR